MNDFTRQLADLRRPRLLIRAARLGLGAYNRTRDLRRLVHVQDTPTPERALKALILAEAELEEIRCAGAAHYSLARHVEVLIALLAESRLLAGLRLSAT
ncbi:DUF6477 family protein [Phaeovulum sp.]|uniref:DUF6477 family protein n=1 Tax=Phaeovulum sp. TaxID=2934796 RepID=UPI00272F7278|nr:DUF6477 family protein [Phaeovulum sp.]MDP1669466.1 DUF6477 family protein [Phaeovulum sp.]MDP3860362.1 DUF6477 family protein [Phaeovulum sp.]MDZ4118255.1 DUF6477 family protein [Phaeovulum sp.]